MKTIHCCLGEHGDEHVGEVVGKRIPRRNHLSMQRDAAFYSSGEHRRDETIFLKPWA